MRLNTNPYLKPLSLCFSLPLRASAPKVLDIQAWKTNVLRLLLKDYRPPTGFRPDKCLHWDGRLPLELKVTQGISRILWIILTGCYLGVSRIFSADLCTGSCMATACALRNMPRARYYTFTYAVCCLGYFQNTSSVDSLDARFTRKHKKSRWRSWIILFTSSCLKYRCRSRPHCEKALNFMGTQIHPSKIPNTHQFLIFSKLSFTIQHVCVTVEVLIPHPWWHLWISKSATHLYTGKINLRRDTTLLDNGGRRHRRAASGRTRQRCCGYKFTERSDAGGWWRRTASRLGQGDSGAVRLRWCSYSDVYSGDGGDGAEAGGGVCCWCRFAGREGGC